MLAIFYKTIAKCPEALQSPHSGSKSALKDGFLAKHFASVHPASVTVNLGSAGVIAYSLDKQNPLLPRYFCFCPKQWYPSFFSLLLDCGFNIDRLAAISFWDLGFWGVWLLRESQEMEVENRLFVLFMVPLIDRQLYFYSDQGKKKMVDGIFYL